MLQYNSITPTGQKAGRKNARTAIYRALYGTGGKFNNCPWLDDDRRRPQDWSLEEILFTVKQNWLDARFDPFRSRMVLDDLNRLCDIRNHAPLSLQDLG